MDSPSISSKDAGHYELTPPSWWTQVYWMVRKNLSTMWIRKIMLLAECIIPLYAVFWAVVFKAVFEDNREVIPSDRRTNLEDLYPYIHAAPKIDVVLSLNESLNGQLNIWETKDDMLQAYEANPGTFFAALEFTNDSVVIGFNRSLKSGFFDADGASLQYTKRGEGQFYPTEFYLRNGLANLHLKIQESLLVDLKDPSFALTSNDNFLTQLVYPCSGAGCVLKWIFPMMYNTAFFFSCQVIVTGVGAEKDSGFFDALSFTGLHRLPYWLGTLLARMPFLLVLSFLFTAGLYATTFLQASDPTLVFVAVYISGLLSTGMGILVGAIASSGAQALGIGFMVIMLYMGLFYLVQFFYIAKGGSRGGVIATFLAPGVAQGRFGWELMEAEGELNGNGLQWNDMRDYTAATMYMGIVGTILYILLAVYCDYMIPRKGAPAAQKNLLFFLTPKFWQKTSQVGIHSNEGVKASGVEKWFEVKDEKTKKMKTVKAVDGVDVELHQG